MTGNYDDINDYKRMCSSCHKKYDSVIDNLKSSKFKEITGIDVNA